MGELLTPLGNKDRLNLALAEDKVWFDVSTWTDGYMSVTGTGVWATAIVTAKFAIVKDPTKLTVFVTSPTFTNTDGIQRLNGVGGLKGIRFVAAEVTAADGSDESAIPSLYVEKYE